MNMFLMFMWSFVILVKVFSKNDTLNSGLDSCRHPGNEVVQVLRSQGATDQGTRGPENQQTGGPGDRRTKRATPKQALEIVRNCRKSPRVSQTARGFGAICKTASKIRTQKLLAFVFAIAR